MNTDKLHIQHLAKICQQKGVEYAIISPGSRCAPLIIAFNRNENIRCLSIIDERSAGFVALGIAQQTNKPVALICTSGSAILNYAPALAEAYYQKVPLLVLSADRPNEWIDQGENQSINQFEVYKNYIKKSYQLPLQINTDKDLWYSDRIISEALNTCIYPDFGPVHINIPLREPLYNLTQGEKSLPKVIDFVKPKYTLGDKEMQALAQEWQNFDKILIVAGGRKSRDKDLEILLQKISKLSNVVVLKESISNLYGSYFIDQIDPNIEIIDAFELDNFTPDLVLSFGAGVVSKKLKFWLRKQEKTVHWHLTTSFEHWDIFQSLSKIIQLDTLAFLEKMQKSTTSNKSNFQKDWWALNLKTKALLNNYLEKQDFNDFSLFSFLTKNFKQNSLVQLGNSTPIRYVNLLALDASKNVVINSNRGVSGIDGVLSTAAGASIAQSSKTCICICGDVASLYDSNALLNLHLNPNYKIIIINNGGGNIFRIIPGPSKLEELEQFFETKHSVSFEKLAATYSFAYFKADSFNNLEENYTNFLDETKKCAILEIKTNGESSANALKNYFTYLKNNIQFN